ncbi:MAG TPA: TonB-dependent receptor [Gemmatimonadota bacterium]|nr:TonB-dependent receptor [Gemmatimonadota bacterium]
MQQPSALRLTSRAAVLVLGVFALLAFGGSAAFAQVTGKVIGTVTDSDTGQPLVGAQVVVEGTNLGNVTNEDGYYFINNVPVGLEQLTAQYLGYQTQTNEQRILAGQTMTVDFQLSSEVVQAEGIVALIEREPLVVRDNTISKTRFTAEETQNLPVDDIESVIDLSAGIYEGQGGFIVRGGRGTESATYVDGALITDFNDQLNTVELSRFAVEEIDVITGGFNAEWGHAQSGIINIVTREGGREYHGNVRFTTDELSDAIEQSYGFNNLQASIGGPIIPDVLTVYGSLEATGAEDFFPAAAGFNPVLGDQLDDSGSTEEILPGNRGDRTLAQAKLTSFLPWQAKATGTYLFSRDQFENYQHSRGLNQFLTTTATRAKTHDFILGYDQQIFQTGERNLNLQVRGQYHLSKFFLGTPLSPQMSELLQDHFGEGICGARPDDEGGPLPCENPDVDAFEEDFLNYRIDDVEFFFEDQQTSSVFNFPTTGLTNPDPVFGQRNLFATRPGFTSNFGKENERRYGIRVDLDSQLNRVHRGKVGVEWNWINLNHIGPHLDDNVFADVWDVDPMLGAAYVQDRLDYGDLVIDLGLRLDHWDPNTMFPALPGVVHCDLSPLGPGECDQSGVAEIVEAETKNELAPRLGVAHPITDATQVRLSYGKFYQLPRLQDFFSSFVTDIAAAGGNNNITYGNPNLDFVETTAFEAGITHLISDNLVLDVVGYNRDRRGAIRLEVFQTGSIDPRVDERRVFINGDNGNVKGFDLSLNKRFSDYWSTNLAWSLQWARGTTSSPTDWAATGGFGRLFDPQEGGGVLLSPPTQLQPEDFDRLHNINWQFTLQFPDDFREGTALGTVLNNFGAFLTYNAQSGVPFTRTSDDGQGFPVEDFGASRLPWFHSGDIRVSKGFDIGDALDLSVFGLVTNFLNRENVVAVFSITGLPDVGGTEFEDSRNPQIPAASAGEVFLVEDATPGFPLSIDDIVPEWQDEFSRQDVNGDGTITLEESQLTFFRGNRALNNSPLNYGEPRQIRFGAEIRF